MNLCKKAYIITAAVAGIILIVVLSQISPVSVRLKTLGVAINLLIPEGNWRPLEIFTSAPVREEHIIESPSGRTLTAHLYRPKSLLQKAPSAMVIYTPFAGGGLDDPRLINILKTFAQAGFITAIPWRTEDALVVSEKDIDDIVSTVNFLKQQQSLGISSFGILGISYGAGPAIAAAHEPEIKDLVRFIISFGGYYDLENTLDFIFTGSFEYKDASGKLEPDPYTYEVLEKTLAHFGLKRERLKNSPEFQKTRERISPRHIVGQTRAEYFIMHSTNDTLIPYTESMRLSDALKEKGASVHFALVSAFEHGVYKKLNFENFRRYYLPSFRDFYNFLYAIISKYQ